MRPVDDWVQIGSKMLSTLCLEASIGPKKVLFQNLPSSVVSICTGLAPAMAWPRFIKDMLNRLCVLSSMCLRQ